MEGRGGSRGRRLGGRGKKGYRQRERGEGEEGGTGGQRGKRRGEDEEGVRVWDEIGGRKEGEEEEEG